MPSLIDKTIHIYENAFVEFWDFSKANRSKQARVDAITQVASICYQSKNAIGSEALYNRLERESIGLPSSSFEFVPILLDYQKSEHKNLLEIEHSHIKKYGEMVEGRYLISNLRALLSDCELYKLADEIREIYNTEDECEIIKRYFKVFLFKVDLPTRSQMVRHRVSWQELSRRYVSGKRVPFEFFISENLKGEVEEHYNKSVELYLKLVESGVKPEEARRVIPQAVYTQIWGAFMPKQLKNFFDLRLDKHAQKEIREVAIAMDKLIRGS